MEKKFVDILICGGKIFFIYKKGWKKQCWKLEYWGFS